MTIPKLYISRTPDGSDFPLPSYESEFHSGLNLAAAIGAPIKISPNERIFVPVGFAIGIPQGFCGQILNYSKIAQEHGIVVSDSPHLLDPADREPLFVLLQNVSSNPYVLHRGDTIAQLVILPVVQGYWQEVESQVTDAVTDEETLVVDEGIEQSQAEKNPFQSLRRPKVSLRNRFKSSDEDES